VKGKLSFNPSKEKPSDQTSLLVALIMVALLVSTPQRKSHLIRRHNIVAIIDEHDVSTPQRKSHLIRLKPQSPRSTLLHRFNPSKEKPSDQTPL